MAQVRKGTACSWGVGITTSASYGRVINLSRRKTSEKTVIKAQDGDIATKVYHGSENIATLEIVPTSASYTTPVIGDTIALTDTNGDVANAYYHIDEVNDVQTIGDAVRITVTASQTADITE